MIAPPKEFEAKFIAAGWTGEPRKLDVEPKNGHVGWEVLRSFNGLHVHPDSRGMECASGDIHFQMEGCDCDIAKMWEALLQTQFMGIALTHNNYSALWIATDGSVFSSNDISNEFGFVGADIVIAIRNELLGIRNQPLLRDHISALQCYGEEYSRGDPRLFDWHRYVAECDE